MQAWFKFLDDQEKFLGKETTKKWLHSLKIVKFDACNLFLEASNAFQIAWFKEHILPKTKKCLFNNNGNAIQIHLQLKGAVEPLKSTKASPFTNKTLQFNPDPLNPSKTFDSIFSSDENLLAIKLLSQLTDPNKEEQEESFNPIVIYGPAGSGKSHLLMAAANELTKQGKKIFYIHAKTFTEHVVQAIRSGKMQEFRQAYRHIDTLILDDIHLLANKNATQEEFFHTFNTLHTASCQMILGSNIAPSQMVGIEPRLISRFEWGISLEMKKVSETSLKSFIAFSAKNFGLELPENIQNFLIETFHKESNLIQQALEALALRTHLTASTHKQLTLQQCEGLLDDLIKTKSTQKITCDEVIEQVCHYFSLKKEELLGKSQTKQCVFPRQIAMYLCRNKLKSKLKQIGSLFSRDHSTVITSIRSIDKAVRNKEIDALSSLKSIQIMLEK